MESDIQSMITDLSEKKINVSKIDDTDINKIAFNINEYIELMYEPNAKTVSNVLSNLYCIEETLEDYFDNIEELPSEQIDILMHIKNDIIYEMFKKNKHHKTIINSLDKKLEGIIGEQMIKELEKENEIILTEKNINKHDWISDFDKIYDKFYDNFKIVIISHFDTARIPNFLLKKYKRIIKHKIDIICSEFINNNYLPILENQTEVLQLKEFFISFCKNELDLLDKNIINIDILRQVFDIFILSNVNYLSVDEVSYEVFCENIQLYEKIFQIQFNKENLEKYIISYNEKSENLQLEDTISRKIGKLKNFFKSKEREYMFLIFSLCLAINGIIKIENKDKLVFNEQLKPNARQKQFLNNLLNNLDRHFNILPFGAISINSYMQSITIHNTLKSFSIDFLDEDLTKKLPIISLEKIDEIMTKSSEHSIKDYLQNIIDSEMTKKQKNYIYNSDIIYKSINITPLNKSLISWSACICISGFLSHGSNHIHDWQYLTVELEKYVDVYYYNWPSSNKKEFVKSIFTTLGKVALGVYSFLSSNIIAKFAALQVSKDSSKENLEMFSAIKKIAKICGKLLARIIASNRVFPFQSITLVSFSLGTHVVKHCLKELYKIGGCNNIIQNVLLAGGATHFKNKENWCKIIDSVVCGRLINCYSQSDYILKYLYNYVTWNTAIGLTELDWESKKVENWNFSHMEMGHRDYRSKLDEIVKIIKFR
jgi:hypothetical protein